MQSQQRQKTTRTTTKPTKITNDVFIITFFLSFRSSIGSWWRCRVDVRCVCVPSFAIVETSASIYRRLKANCVCILRSDILGKWNQNFTLHKLGSMMWLCAAMSVIMVYLWHIENRSTLEHTDSITQRQPKRFINVNEIGLCNGQIECDVLKV